jgi:hypothetical protein
MGQVEVLELEDRIEYKKKRHDFDEYCFSDVRGGV